MSFDRPRPDAQPCPTLLNKSDAMLYAASQLERAVGDLELVSILKDAFAKQDMTDAMKGDAKGQATLADIRKVASGIVDKDIQMAAMRAAAAEIRALANETKLAEARAGLSS